MPRTQPSHLTYREALNLIPDTGLREQALQNCDCLDELVGRASTLGDVVAQGFWFESSPEGLPYWRDQLPLLDGMPLPVLSAEVG